MQNVLQWLTLRVLSQTGLAAAKLCGLSLAHCPLSDCEAEGIVLLTVMRVRRIALNPLAEK